MTSERDITVGALLAALDRRFPVACAEEWDQVGLLVGEVDRAVSGVLVTLDATAEAVARASELGANVLLTHHPAYLEAPARVERGQGPKGALEAAISRGVAMIAMHTNLDRSPAGAGALARALGIEVSGPLESGVEPVSLVVTYAPVSAIETLRDAMSAAGAGKLGEYERCAFTSEGLGHFDPTASAHPVAEDRGEGLAEVRLEMVTPRGNTALVLEAARAAHPYEEPVILATDCLRARGAARLGRIGRWREGATLSDLAAHVGAVLGCRCRVYGDPMRPVGRVALANGSAGSLVADAIHSADTLVAGEVRYHDALDAVASGLAIVEAGHDATEWPLVQVLGETARDIAGNAVRVEIEGARNIWWTMEDSDV